MISKTHHRFKVEEPHNQRNPLFFAKKEQAIAYLHNHPHAILKKRIAVDYAFPLDQKIHQVVWIKVNEKKR